MSEPTVRKPHSDWAGYRAERRNKFSGGHTVIVDYEWAEKQGVPVAEDYRENGGRYGVVCDTHSTTTPAPSLPVARELMADPTIFCEACRDIYEQIPAQPCVSCDGTGHDQSNDGRLCRRCGGTGEAADA